MQYIKKRDGRVVEFNKNKIILNFTKVITVIKDSIIAANFPSYPRPKLKIQ